MPEDTPQAVQQVEGDTTPAMPTETKPADVQGEVLPDGVSDRTKQEFEKLKAHNKQLAEELAQFKASTPKKSALDAFNPAPAVTSNLTPAQVDQITENFIDPEGYVDVGAFKAALHKANQEALLARQEAAEARKEIATFSHTDATEKTYAKHPYLDPYNENFDEKFSNLVRLEILRQMTEDGKENYLQAADRVQKEFYDPVPAIKERQAKAESLLKEESEKEKANVDKRSQANANPGVQQRETSPQEHQRLVELSRKGDREAIAKRLRAAGV